jgi:hypothetical protein
LNCKSFVKKSQTGIFEFDTKAMETTAKKLAQLVNEKRSDWLMEKLFLNLETFQDLKNEDKRELLEKAIFYQIGNIVIMTLK